MAWQFCTTHHLARAVMDGLAGVLSGALLTGCVQGGLSNSTRRHSTYCTNLCGWCLGPVACAPSHLHTKASSVPWQAAPLSSDEVSVL